MAQQFQVLAVLPEEPSSIPSAHMMGNDYNSSPREFSAL